MKVAVYSTKPYDRECLTRANQGKHQLLFLEASLTTDTVMLAQNCRTVCCFVNDQLHAEVLKRLWDQGVRFIALRCTGFNQVDLPTARALGLVIARVPEYSPHAIAEHTLGLILMLNRHLHRAHYRIRENDYSLNGLLGFDLVGKTVAILGTGAIGSVFARIMLGMGCRVIAYDPCPSDDLAEQGVVYKALDELWASADIVSLHCPLTPVNYHMIDQTVLEQMKQGVMLINTSRGALVDTRAVIAGLKSGQIGYLGLDVYEEEGGLFFEDYSLQLLQDDVFARLLTFPNVVITGHQAFFTHEALTTIGDTTIANISHYEQDQLAQVHLVD